MNDNQYLLVDGLLFLEPFFLPDRILFLLWGLALLILSLYFPFLLLVYV